MHHQAFLDDKIAKCSLVLIFVTIPQPLLLPRRCLCLLLNQLYNRLEFLPIQVITGQLLKECLLVEPLSISMINFFREILPYDMEKLNLHNIHNR